MMIKRKVAVFTGNRAEYGLQYPIIKAIDQHPRLEYYLLVSGAHLQEDFGSTKSEIEKDGLDIYAEVKMRMEQDTLYSTAQAIGTGILSLSDILNELVPDFFVVYADRFEGFSAVITSTQMNIATAHIEGGDLTEGGALDDSVRHAMTKLSHLHFCTNSEAESRILGLGEQAWRVHNVGFPAIDLLAAGNFASLAEVEEKYRIDILMPIVVYTQHSVTIEHSKAREQVRPALEALVHLAEKGTQVIITYPNNDAGGKRIIEELENLKRRRISGIQIHDSLGRYFYHGFLNVCGRAGIGACVGNSSSGIKETPFFGCPTVNIGSRQNGRLRSTNIIDTRYDSNEIQNAIERSLFDESFREECSRCENPYGKGGSGRKIAEVLASIPLDRKLYNKVMTY